MTAPWLSVVMPTYNGARYLRDALESIAAQQVEDIELIVIDDGSTDETFTIVSESASRIRQRVVRRQHTGNWVAGTNHGLSIAQGEFASILHQDDRWKPGRLATLKRLAESHPQAVLFLHPAEYIDEQGRGLGNWRCPLPTDGKELSPVEVIEHLLIQNFIAMPSPLFRRQTALNVGGLDETLWYAADWDFWLKLAAAGKSVYHSVPLADFRVHPHSQTIQRSGHNEDFRRQLETVLERHLAIWASHSEITRSVRSAAHYSVEVNASLAALAHGRRLPWLWLVRDFALLGPAGWRRYLRASRIIERIAARWRLRRSANEAAACLEPQRNEGH